MMMSRIVFVVIDALSMLMFMYSYSFTHHLLLAYSFITLYLPILSPITSLTLCLTSIIVVVLSLYLCYLHHLSYSFSYCVNV